VEEDINACAGRKAGQNTYIPTYTHIYIGKSKAIPLQAWTGPEGSRRLRLPDFETIGT